MPLAMPPEPLTPLENDTEDDDAIKAFSPKVLGEWKILVSRRLTAFEGCKPKAR